MRRTRSYGLHHRRQDGGGSYDLVSLHRQEGSTGHLVSVFEQWLPILVQTFPLPLNRKLNH